MTQKPINAVERWFLEHRGIKPETLRDNRVETTDLEARWKVGSTWKVRTGFAPGEKRKFKYDPPGHPLAAWHLRVKSLEITDPVIVTEGESDALRLWQEGGKDLYGQITALPGCDAITPELAAKLAKRSEKTQLYFVLDNDKPENGDAYNPDDWKEAKNPVRKTDESWKRIKSLLPKARRIYLPPDYKDLCEYLNIYSVRDFNEFVVNAEARYNFTRLDLSQAASAPDWLWQDIIPRSQFGILQGESNVGKSLIYQAFAVAMANGEERFLGKKINPTRDGRSFIGDEENPEEVLRHRFTQLGLRPENQKKIFVANGAGIRLDMDGDKLFEDISNFNPDAVFLDSFVRLHMEDENNSGAVSKMYNAAVLPLARQLGASVWLLHHVNKSASGDSRQRTRGSTDITAGADFAWDLVDHMGEVPYKLLSRFKVRSGTVHKDIRFRIEDGDNESLSFPLMSAVADVL